MSPDDVEIGQCQQDCDCKGSSQAGRKRAAALISWKGNWDQAPATRPRRMVLANAEGRRKEREGEQEDAHGTNCSRPGAHPWRPNR